jgi:hypothetical protein
VIKARNPDSPAPRPGTQLQKDRPSKAAAKAARQHERDVVRAEQRKTAETEARLKAEIEAIGEGFPGPRWGRALERGRDRPWPST